MHKIGTFQGEHTETQIHPSPRVLQLNVTTRDAELPLLPGEDNQPDSCQLCFESSMPSDPILTSEKAIVLRPGQGYLFKKSRVSTQLAKDHCKRIIKLH